MTAMELLASLLDYYDEHKALGWWFAEHVTEIRSLVDESEHTQKESSS